MAWRGYVSVDFLERKGVSRTSGKIYPHPGDNYSIECKTDGSGIHCDFAGTGKNPVLPELLSEGDFSQFTLHLSLVGPNYPRNGLYRWHGANAEIQAYKLVIVTNKLSDGCELYRRIMSRRIQPHTPYDKPIAPKPCEDWGALISTIRDLVSATFRHWADVKRGYPLDV